MEFILITFIIHINDHTLYNVKVLLYFCSNKLT
jgi:hypothetical protein